MRNIWRNLGRTRVGYFGCKCSNRWVFSRILITLTLSTLLIWTVKLQKELLPYLKFRVSLATPKIWNDSSCPNIATSSLVCVVQCVTAHQKEKWWRHSMTSLLLILNWLYLRNYRCPKKKFFVKCTWKWSYIAYVDFYLNPSYFHITPRN